MKDLGSIYDCLEGWARSSLILAFTSMIGEESHIMITKNNYFFSKMKCYVGLMIDRDVAGKRTTTR